MQVTLTGFPDRWHESVRKERGKDSKVFSLSSGGMQLLSAELNWGTWWEEHVWLERAGVLGMVAQKARLRKLWPGPTDQTCPRKAMAVMIVETLVPVRREGALSHVSTFPAVCPLMPLS